MKLQRFIGNFDLNKKKFITIIEKELINQIRNVLRLKVGDTIILCDGKLKEGYAQIFKIEKNKILCEIVKSNVSTQESVIVTKLYCSLLKRENLELVVQKTTRLESER